MQIIELFGPMAVGKSTLYQQCLLQKLSHRDWISAPEALRLLMRTVLYMNKSPVKRILGSIVMNIDAFAPLLNEKLALKELGAQALTNNAEKWDKLIGQHMTRQAALNHHDGLLKLRRNRYLLEFLELLALYEEHLPGQKIFLDEGICKRCGGTLLESATDSSVGLVDASSLPSAVICLNGSPDTIYARLIGREKARSNYGGALAIRDLNDVEIYDYVTEAVQRTDKVCDVLENVGLKVLRVNAERPLVEQLNQALPFINDL